MLCVPGSAESNTNMQVLFKLEIVLLPEEHLIYVTFFMVAWLCHLY